MSIGRTNLSEWSLLQDGYVFCGEFKYKENQDVTPKVYAQGWATRLTGNFDLVYKTRIGIDSQNLIK